MGISPVNITAAIILSCQLFCLFCRSFIDENPKYIARQIDMNASDKGRNSGVGPNMLLAYIIFIVTFPTAQIIDAISKVILFFDL